jgi:hypothetical protein
MTVMKKYLLAAVAACALLASTAYRKVLLCHELVSLAIADDKRRRVFDGSKSLGTRGRSGERAV